MLTFDKSACFKNLDNAIINYKNKKLTYTLKIDN